MLLLPGLHQPCYPPARPDTAEPPREPQHPTPARGPCALGHIPAQAERDAGQVTGMVKHVPAQPCSQPWLPPPPSAVTGCLWLVWVGAVGTGAAQTRHGAFLPLPPPGSSSSPQDSPGWKRSSLGGGWRISAPHRWVRSRGTREVTPTPPSPCNEGSAALSCRCPARSRGARTGPDGSS